jgi:hypothetical protein
LDTRSFLASSDNGSDSLTKRLVGTCSIGANSLVAQPVSGFAPGRASDLSRRWQHTTINQQQQQKKIKKKKKNHIVVQRVDATFISPANINILGKARRRRESEQTLGRVVHGTIRTPTGSVGTAHACSGQADAFCQLFRTRVLWEFCGVSIPSMA